MSFNIEGFEIIPGVAAASLCEAHIRHIASLSLAGAGSRDLLEQRWCMDVAVHLQQDIRLRELLANDAVPVQCTYFDKSPGSNWLVAYHQDLTIPVASRLESTLCGAWSVKQGVTFVQPPLPVLESLVAVRLHLDDSDDCNGPLRVLAGTHVYGRIEPSEIEGLRSRHREVSCVAPQGSALVLKPLLLHASSKSREPQPRRVLHFLFGPPQLPAGLSWRATVQQDVTIER